MTCHSYKNCVSFLRLDLNKLLLLTFMWIFIFKDLRNYSIPFTEQCQQWRPQQQREQQQQICKNSSNYTIKNKNKSHSNIRISNKNNSNGKNYNSNSHNDDNRDRSYNKNSNKNNYTSGRNAEYLYDVPNDRSCEESDCDSSKSGNTLPPNQVKCTRLLWANTPVQCVSRIPADKNGTVIFNVKLSNWVSLLASCRDGRLGKHDSWSDSLGYRSLRYRECTGFKMSNEDQCIFYINFGERNQKYFDKNGNCGHCASSP